MIKYINKENEIFEDEYDINIARHSCAHLLAIAVKRLYKDSKLTIGPSTDSGFYYDFDNLNIKNEDLEKIEKEMKSILKENVRTSVYTLDKQEALKEVSNNEYKCEIINDLEDGENITFFKHGDFTDMCVGPHMLYFKKIGAFKLLSTTGAYWRGDEKNKMLTRIYGTCFQNKELLAEDLEAREQAKLRDHNKLGRELEYFTTVDMIGQGLPIILPKGATVIQKLQRFVEDEERLRGYLITKTPFMAKSDLYKVSGHWDHYRDSMFVIGDENDKDVLALRPMTCPFQFMAFKNRGKSYKDLPLRYNETSTLFRKEESGEMHGLIRVRQFTISEGHIAARLDQLKNEIVGVIDLINYFMKVLKLEDDISFRFSKWDPNDKEKYMGDAEVWEHSQKVLKEILDDLNIDYVEAEGEAAYYGPKLDIQAKNVYGKEDTIITVQVDFQLAEQFDMTYIDQDGNKVNPVVIHRTSIGCYERTLAMLIEKYNANFPLWLAPVQVKVLPITDNEVEYSNEVYDKLTRAGYYVEKDNEYSKIGNKIRNARLERVPYMVILGKNEMENNCISVKGRDNVEYKDITIDEFIEILNKEVKEQLAK